MTTEKTDYPEDPAKGDFGMKAETGVYERKSEPAPETPEEK